MKVLIIDNGTKHLGKLKELLSGDDLVIMPYLRKFTDMTEYQLIILSGGSQVSVVNAPELFREEISLLRTGHKPVIGICEGCEIIAYAFGAKMEYRQYKTRGLRVIEPLPNQGLFEGLPKIKVFEAHHWAITDLGKYLKGLAKSRTGYEIIKHKTKNIFGLQFHPEMLDNESAGDEIFRRIISKLFNKDHEIQFD